MLAYIKVVILMDFVSVFFKLLLFVAQLIMGLYSGRICTFSVNFVSVWGKKLGFGFRV